MQKTTTTFLFGMCNYMVDSDVGTGNFSLVLVILRSHVPPGMDWLSWRFSRCGSVIRISAILAMIHFLLEALKANKGSLITVGVHPFRIRIPNSLPRKLLGIYSNLCRCSTTS